jgi:nitrogen fixation/metabolism regulation signal transduction histidine kinase
MQFRSNDPKQPPRHERRILAYSFLAGLPAVVASMAFLWGGDYTTKVQWTLTIAIVGCWLGFSLAVRERVVFPLRTLSNLLAALREGDYSLRARVAKEDALGEVMVEVNMMGQMLREQRLSAVEATNLLRKVMGEIDVAVFAFDAQDRLRLVNRAGETLLGAPEERLLGRFATELDLEDCLDDKAPRTLQKSFPGGSGRWGVARSTFHEQGVPHRLLVVSDLTRELREEELQAWQRLVRVLSHELNNSLAPIQSITGSLRSMLRQPAPSPDWKQDMEQGLGAIGSRAEALGRFTSAYARLAKLPPPNLEPVEVRDCVERVAEIEKATGVRVEPGPSIRVDADAAQLEQLLINLVRNAADAASQTGGGLKLGWDRNGKMVQIHVVDDGPGLSSDANLFVPFFTTKANGTGIGLVLSRKIAENHGGRLTLANRSDAPGCIACLELPLVRT